ncbi:hypothetical protein MRB53_038981 [Persea americana]|nr:hypothetical protein MRB53_038981 [Persea americana]
MSEVESVLKNVKRRQIKQHKLVKNVQLEMLEVLMQRQRNYQAEVEDRLVKKKDGKISDYVKKENIEATTISEALAEETKDADVKPGDIGMQDLRSAKQPDLVKGGSHENISARRSGMADFVV